MSKISRYLDRQTKVSQEEFDESLTEDERAQQDIVQEEALEVPAVVDDVTDEQIDIAEDEAEEAAEEVADLPADVQEAAELEAEVVEEKASMEEFVQVLQHGRRSKTYSPQTAALVQAKLDRLNATFGGEATSVSLEGYGNDNLDDYYRVSIEAFEGFAKRMEDVFNNAVRALADKINKKWGHDSYIKKGKALNMRADAVLSGTAKEQPYVAKGKSVAGDFQIGGEFSGDVLAALTHDLRFLSGEGSKLVKNIDSFLSKTMDIVETAVKDGGKGKTGDLVAKVLDLPRPADQLSEVAFKGAMAGGLVFTKPDNKAKEGDRRGAYKDIIRAAIPTVDGVRFKGDAADVTVDKALADKLAKSAKNLVAMALKLVESEGLKSLNTFYRRIETQQRAVKSANSTSWGENKDLNVLASGLIGMGGQQFNVYYTLLNTALDNAAEAISLAEKAVTKTAAAPAAAE